MSIYLLRHFKVIDNKKSFLSASEFNEWVNEYDKLELKPKEVKLKNFNRVFVSPLNRTIKTAKYLNLNFEILNELKEVENVKFNFNIKLPKFLWLIISRILWRLNLSNSEILTSNLFKPKFTISVFKFSKIALQI